MNKRRLIIFLVFQDHLNRSELCLQEDKYVQHIISYPLFSTYLLFTFIGRNYPCSFQTICILYNDNHFAEKNVFLSFQLIVL